MANEHEYDKDLGQTKRISPFIQEEPYDSDDAAESYETSGRRGDAAYAADGAAYDDAYEDAYDNEAYGDEEYSDEEYDEEEYDDDEYAQQPVFFSTLMGKVIAGVIALLIVALAALLVIRFTSGPKEQKLPSAEDAKPPVTAETTQAPDTIVFVPSLMETPTPTPAPTKAPTAEPKPTDSPLPIIMTNTPTPSPSPTVSPSPSPSPTPVPTVTPEPTPVPEIGTGEVNRDAKLRESVSGSVKSTIKKGEKVTVHESILDKDSKIWYSLTVDDLEMTGWMRDYVVDLDKKIAKPTHTPNLTATPEPEKEASEKEEPKKAEPEKSETTPEPTATPDPSVIGAGRTTKEANVRKVMNGKVLVQLRKNKKVEILSAKTDKNGKLWYEVRPEGSSTVGFVRDYLIKLDDGVKIAAPTATPKQDKTPASEVEEDETEKGEAEPEKQEESILDREIIGKAKTKKPANIRVKPASGAKLVRQLSKGIELMVLEKYQDEDGNIWYEVCTESGRTQGFARDYLLQLSDVDPDREALTYSRE